MYIDSVQRIRRTKLQNRFCRLKLLDTILWACGVFSLRIIRVVERRLNQIGQK